MFWLTDVLVGRQSHIDYRHYVEQAHFERARVDVLSGLSDHTLKDIGLTRDDIRGIAEEVARKGRNLSVLRYREQVVDQVDGNHKVSVPKVVEEAQVGNDLRRAA